MALAENLPKRAFKRYWIKLLDIRLNLAYGEQTDYFDDACQLYRLDSSRQEGGQPIAVLISTTKQLATMLAGTNGSRAPSDYLSNSSQIVTIDDQGWENSRGGRLCQCMEC